MHPDSITPSKLNDLRAAAEHAWADDTRHEGFVGHPSPCQGQCYVTSSWLAKKLGGHVGTKQGHFFWVSPEKSHIIDLTGDWFAYPPIHESRRSPDDDPHHHTWRAGPVMYKRADHPLYKGFRVLPEYPDHQRAALFAKRADAALRGHRVADQMGDAYQGDTPQKQEDWAMNAPMPFLHDEPNYDPEAGNGEYQFVIANGQVHVSPHHTHDDLITHAGQHPESEGPMAIGYVNVHQGHALWMVSTNMSMRGLHDMLTNYSDTVGWQFDGMVGADGQHLHDDFGPKMSMWYRYRRDGHLVLSKSPLPHASRIRIVGKTAYVYGGSLDSAMMDWAADTGYHLKLAEYPGEDRFWSKVDKTPGFGPWGDCWQWTAGTSNGYGSFQVGTNRQSRTVKAHRYAYEELVGTAGSRHVLHRCDNPRCVNPEHLWLGSNQDNIKDRVAKGRTGGLNHGVGEANNAAKLAQVQADEIRHRYAQGGITQRQLATQYSVSQRTINKIVNEASYPGGGDMTDKMRPKETLDVFNRGDTDFQPERSNPDMDLGSNLKCGFCGRRFEDIAQLRLHERAHEPLDAEEIPDGHFPQIDDMDAPLPFRRRQPSPNWGETIACMVLPDHHTAARHPRFDLYASLFGYDRDDGLRFYGAFRAGQLVGYGTVRLNIQAEPEVVMIDALEHRSGIGSAILSLIQRHYGSFYTHTDSEGGAALLRRMGAANIKGQFWRWAAGSDPKDMIEEAIPFVYDVQDDDIHIGYAGQQTRDVQHRNNGRFTPGGIVEGYYEPGGKIVFVGQTNTPVSYYHFAQLWYHRFRQMEISSMETEDAQGKTHKLAAQNIGPYLKTLVTSDQAAHNAYRALTQAGGKVYVVGGAVRGAVRDALRDALRQHEPKDLDLMVAGLPIEQAEHVLSQLPGNVILTGKRFGVLRYKVGGQQVEVALPRQDQYETSRRGKGVITVDHNLPVEADLTRRDFTANSMAVDLDSGNLIDPHGGVRDLDAHVLRTTHPDSFREDPSRLVRALVAHSRFGLQPDERTRGEMVANGHLLRDESPDTLNPVLDKLFTSGHPASAIRLARETQILPHLFPEVAENWDYDQNNPHHRHVLGDHLLNVLDNVSRESSDPDLRLAALYHDVGKPASQWADPDTGMAHYYLGPNGQGANHEDVGARMVQSRMEDLHYPRARINRVRDLVQSHMFPAFDNPKGARRFMSNVGPLADDLLTLRGADMTGKGQTQEEVAERTHVDTMRQLVDQVRKNQQPTDLSNLAINGDDLINMGMQPGPQMGTILRSLVQDVINEPALNTPDALMQRAQTYVNAQPA